MKILLLGATGTIGSALATELAADHDVVRVGHTVGDGVDDAADTTDPKALRALYGRHAPFDAVVCTAGVFSLDPLTEIDDEGFASTIASKLVAQANVVRLALPHLADGGSATVTTGQVEAIPGDAPIALVTANLGLRAFVAAAARSAPRGIRVNAVSPPFVRETLEAMGQDGAGGIPVAELAETYRAVVEGEASGEEAEPAA